MNRKELIGGAASLLLCQGAMSQQSNSASSAALPASKNDFPIVTSRTFLNCARWHSMGASSVTAAKTYLDYTLSRSPFSRPVLNTMEDDVRGHFAALINASPLEICYVQSTMMGENLVLLGVSASRPGGNIVTDELHYQGSIYLYRSLLRKGRDVRIVKARNGRIERNDLKQAIDKETCLVSLSLVSFANGYTTSIAFARSPIPGERTSMQILCRPRGLSP
jgi:selenocysteine lyase/cysteine desulfurase